MKKILLLFITFFTFVACSTSDMEETHDNSVSVNNKNFDIGIFSIGTIQGNKIFIELMSNAYFEFGEGFYSNFSILNSTGENFDDGIHVFNYSQNMVNGTFYEGEYYVENNPFTTNNFEEIEGNIINGTITIEKNNNTYTITIECIDDSQNEFILNYKGELVEY